MRMDIDSRVRNGKISQDASNKIKEAIAASEGKVLRLTIETIGNNRSDAQNKYYFSTVVPIFQRGLLEIGDRKTREETHIFIKLNTKCCWRTVSNPKTGETLDTLISSAEMTVGDWILWMEEIAQLASTFLDCFIPAPDLNWKQLEKEEKKTLKPKL